jgi:hypothetical protein
MILEIILGILIGLGIAWLIGSRKVEDLRDWYTYGKGKKYR